MNTLCPQCKGNKVIYPMGGIPADCPTCQGTGNMTGTIKRELKVNPKSAVDLKLELARSGKNVNSIPGKQ